MRRRRRRRRQPRHIFESIFLGGFYFHQKKPKVCIKIKSPPPPSAAASSAAQRNAAANAAPPPPPPPLRNAHPHPRQKTSFARAFGLLSARRSSTQFRFRGNPFSSFFCTSSPPAFSPQTPTRHSTSASAFVHSLQRLPPLPPPTSPPVHQPSSSHPRSGLSSQTRLVFQTFARRSRAGPSRPHPCLSPTPSNPRTL
jgi:hypothetical protein